jgi:8-oxo-dGTP diphosphatase
MTTYCNPKVGVGVFLCKGDKILVGKRKGSHGAGEWSLPGGHLEPGEEFRECCQREVFEETGIEIIHVDFFDLTNDLFPKEGLHYVTLFFVARVDKKTEAILMEPDKCEEWRWVAFKEGEESKWLSPLFPPLYQLLEYIRDTYYLTAEDNTGCV